MVNNSLLLREVGEAMYGPRWQSELARDLDVAIRTMQRWAAGDAPLPAGLYLDCLQLATERAAMLDDLIDRLKQARDF